jgi:LemA protein
MIDILGWFWTSAILVIAVGTVVLLIAIYNQLVRLRQNVRQGVADIDAQLRQRHDLIPNLVEAVKGYAGHEAATLEAVIAARNAAAKGDAPGAAGEAQLKLALDNLLALGEAYPDLKASANFQSLQNELGDVEDKLAAARRALNAAAARFNAARESFPAVLFAGMLGFGEADFSRLAESEKGVVDQTPKVAF